MVHRTQCRTQSVLLLAVHGLPEGFRYQFPYATVRSGTGAVQQDCYGCPVVTGITALRGIATGMAGHDLPAGPVMNIDGMCPDCHQYFLPRILRAAGVMVTRIEPYFPVASRLEVFIPDGIESKPGQGHEGCAVSFKQVCYLPASDISARSSRRP